MTISAANVILCRGVISPLTISTTSSLSRMSFSTNFSSSPLPVLMASSTPAVHLQLLMAMMICPGHLNTHLVLSVVSFEQLMADLINVSLIMASTSLSHFSTLPFLSPWLVTTGLKNSTTSFSDDFMLSTSSCWLKSMLSMASKHFFMYLVTRVGSLDLERISRSSSSDKKQNLGN